jgi:hypothetical protein
MEIQALTLVLAEKDLNDLVVRHQSEDLPVEELRFRLTPEGLQVSGEYPLFMRVSFEMRWELGIHNGNVTARLTYFKALGLGVPVFKEMLLKLLRESLARKDWFQLEGEDTVVVHVDRWLAKEGVPLRTNLTSIRCLDQVMIVEARADGPRQQQSFGDAG